MNGERRREGSMIKIRRGGSEWREGEGGGRGRVNGERRREGSMIKIGRGGSEWREGEGGGKRTGESDLVHHISHFVAALCCEWQCCGSRNGLGRKPVPFLLMVLANACCCHIAMAPL